jgi:hypothetical protein
MTEEYHRLRTGFWYDSTFPVARRELVNPDFAHGLVKTMCKFRAATAPRRSTNADRPDEIGVLYKQTRRE